MSTTTSHTPESEGASSQASGSDATAEGAGGPRSARLIQNEATTEIPVHLLFRDDPEPVSVPLSPAVVGRRRGTGEQPRVRRPAPGRAPRPVPEVEPELVERPARVLSGAVGVLAGACGVAGCVLTSWWSGALPPSVTGALELPSAVGAGFGPAQWAAYAGAGALGLFGFGGLARGRTGRAWVLGLFGRYRGTVRRTGLMWINPLVLRRRVDVRLRHWRSEPMSVVDANGVALRVVVLVVWRVKDTARATLGIEDHEEYLRACVEAALTRLLSQLPAELPPAVVKDVTLRNTDAVGEALTRLVAVDTAPVGLEVFSVQPIRIEYAPEVAAVMQRRRVAALDAQHRDTVLSSVVDSVEDTVTRLTMRGLVELDDYERKALVKDLTVAFYTGRREASS
ncbi:SPFH domain-containing protein [Streptomyces sp. 142MFCol3.1]|uniref:SPFH domain-containing protein n=1 Tax=Streptomyces sp. 142MFCol3.1 TaxID=1172179 RepID=UPI0003FAD52D|nr:SPFH domain-containing protein [Streptomyces sp. 142MFCol3.1]